MHITISCIVAQTYCFCEQCMSDIFSTIIIHTDTHTHKHIYYICSPAYTCTFTHTQTACMGILNCMYVVHSPNLLVSRSQILSSIAQHRRGKGLGAFPGDDVSFPLGLGEVINVNRRFGGKGLAMRDDQPLCYKIWKLFIFHFSCWWLHSNLSNISKRTVSYHKFSMVLYNIVVAKPWEKLLAMMTPRDGWCPLNNV